MAELAYVQRMKIKYPIYLFSFTLITANLSADTLFSYGGDYISSASVNNSRLSTGSGTGPYLETLAFDDTTVLSPTSNYTGPNFYGGFRFSSSNVDGIISRNQIRDNGTADRIYLQPFSASTFDGSTLSFHAAYIFKQEDFNTGFTFGSNTIDGLSFTNGGFNAGTARFIVEVGDTYYVSNTTSGNGPGDFSLDSIDLATETWAVYDPATEIDFDQGAATFNLLALNNVTAVGLYTEHDSFTNSNSTPFGLGIEGFTVTGIPEPSSLALILGLGVTGFAAMRRRPRRV